MKLFPEKLIHFKLNDSQDKTLEKLKRKTEFSEKLYSSHSEKSFIGIVEKGQFKIISSAIGLGAFCTMNGNIEKEEGSVKVEMNFPFKILTSVMLIFILFGKISLLFKPPFISFGWIFGLILQILMVRFVFVGIFFSISAKHSLNQFRDVLDVEFSNKSKV